MSDVLLLGGTGTLGQALLDKLSKADHTIKVVSRDEHKQAMLKKRFPKVSFALGDIRDYTSIRPHFQKNQHVFHVAALKHVDILEENPVECVRTNVDGTRNSLACAIDAGVSNFIFSSTDKAIDPINVYGSSKAIAERVVFKSNFKYGPRCSVFRWGNVIGSAGSVIPYFIQTIKTESTAYVTDERMTRFWLTIDQAVDYMLETYPTADLGKTMLYPQMKAASVLRVVEMIRDILGHAAVKIVYTGLRPGEKLHESLVSVHDVNHINSQTCAQYTDDELKLLLEPIVKKYA